MTVGNRVFSGKGAREEAAKALTLTILSWRDDQTMQPRGQFRGFEILSKGRAADSGSFRRMSASRSFCSRASHVFREPESGESGWHRTEHRAHTEESGQARRRAAEPRGTRIEKELVDYQAQADRPFEHEERLKQLLARQTELNSLLGSR